jgi:hypothetical protein
MLLPGGGGRKSQTVAPLEFFGGDGRALYSVKRMDGTNTYYPSEMERELIGVAIQPKQFPVGTTLSLTWSMELRFDSDDVLAAGYLMEVRVAGLPGVLTPAVTGPNVGALSNSVLISSSRLGLSRGVKEARAFSVNFSRLDGGGSSSDFTEFGVKSVGPEIPSGDVYISVKLVAWDVDDSTIAPVGQVSLLMPDAYLRVEQI